MTFQDLKADYMFQKGEAGYRIECKQRLNLSAHAYAVLVNDIEAFQVPRKKADYLPTHTMIKTVFMNFRESADASIALALELRRAELTRQLIGLEPEGLRQKAVQLLLAQYERELIDKVQGRQERAHSFSISLDDGFRECLSSDDCQREGAYYKERVGLYLKAVLEEYAERTYIERERIFFKRTIDEIELAVKGNLLRLTLHSIRKGADEEKNQVLYVKPIGIYQDSEHLYNYLVGLSSVCKTGPWRAQSIRITSIKHAKCLTQTAFISKEERKLVASKLYERGVQFLSSSSDTQKVVVQFTPNGEKLYQRLLHLRPRCSKKSEGRIYEFDCTEFQAEAYFFKYGADAKILAPHGLAKKFLRKYSAALARYQEDPCK